MRSGTLRKGADGFRLCIAEVFDKLCIQMLYSLGKSLKTSESIVSPSCYKCNDSGQLSPFLLSSGTNKDVPLGRINKTPFNLRSHELLPCLFFTEIS